jgi:CRISPR-associated protein Cmr3
MSNDKHTHSLALVPRDGFFVKDGRGWQTSARTSVLDWPWPTTVRGALTTVSGKIAEQRETRRFGPEEWKDHQKDITIGAAVAMRRVVPGGGWSRMWPVPADALWLEERTSVLRLKPKAPATSTLGRGAPEGHAGAREALWVAQNVANSAKPLAPPRWWEEATLADWLSGECVKTDPGRAPREQHPRMTSRLQVHVGIRGETLTGDDGILFAHEVTETLERSTHRREGGKREVAEWAIGAEVTWPLDAVPDGRLARLGSDSRIAWIETVEDEHLFDMPPTVRSAFGGGSAGLRLMVVTPACFTGGWLPDGFVPVHESGTWVFRGRLPRPDGAPHAPIYDSELILRAAFVPRPMHISGWDMASDKARGGAPRVTSRLVPPGAVYFFGRAGDQRKPFTADDAAALWLAPLGTHDNEGFGRTREGFGRVVPGIWNPEDTE